MDQERPEEVPNVEDYDNLDVSNLPLAERPKDPRAWHCKTAKELDLWRYSSDYQTQKGGMRDLQNETGISVDLPDVY